MKNVKFLAVVFFVAAATVAIAQPKTAVKINLLSPIARTFNIALERAITEDGSLQIGFYYSGYKFPGDGGVKMSGFGITPEYRWYLSETPAPNGFYVAPFIRYASLTLSTDDGSNDEATMTTFGGGLVVGRQWVFKERVTLDLFIGPKYQTRDLKVKSGSDSEKFDLNFFNPFGIRGGVTLGIAF
jgi:hypothetical protein